MALLHPVTGLSQTLKPVAQTEAFTDYVLSNDSLHAAYRFELTIPHDGVRQTWRILEQEVVPRQITSEDVRGDLDFILMDVRDRAPLIEIENPGVYRKQNVASLLLHVTRPSASENELLVTRHLRVRVYTEPLWNETEVVRSREITSTQQSPFASGTWYKIPVTRDGIHILNRAYLQDLGIDPASIDPRNIQIWSTDGYMLPRLNSDPRPEFRQLPILVNGESDGVFGASDAVIFYGNSQNRTWFDTETNRYQHQIHYYSNSNYVFLTVGSEPGLRLQETAVQGSPSRTVTTFRDFIWKEEDLRRPDNRTKSGLLWFGQLFTTEAFARDQSILRDTLQGFVQGSTINIEANFIARGTRNSRFEITVGNTIVGATQINGIANPNSSSGRAANFGSINQPLNNANLQNGIIDIRAQFSSFSSDGNGWLDWVRLEADRELLARNGVLRYWAPVNGNQNEVAEFVLQGFTNRPLVMDVSNPLQPVLLPTQSSGNAYRAIHRADAGRAYVAQTRFFTPAPGTRVDPQNLRGVTGYPNYIIVTSEALLDEANEFAAYRSQNGGWEPVVVTQNQIFNEFSGGVPDVTAIRDYVRFLYQRAGLDDTRMPRHLLLFGNTTSDYRGIDSGAAMTNHVFSYQSLESLNRATTYGSDDYYVLLDSNEGIWAPTPAPVATFERIDMGVGRFPVQTPAEARVMMRKIEQYEHPSTFGDWRTIFTFSSDNHMNSGREEYDLHVWNADGTAERIDRDASGVRVNKVYQVSFPTVNTPAGLAAPEATQAFINSINNGTLVMNFSGHGSEQLLTAERLFRSEDIPRLINNDRQTIFVTATCDFGRFDDPTEYSGAEKLMNWSNGGAIAAFTTTRVVFTSSLETSYNFGLNIQLTLEMVRRDNEGLPQTLGDIYRRTKNTTVGASFNSRKFVLLGDPAMRIGLPRTQMNITSINDQQLDGINNRINLRALDQARVSGQVLNPDGSLNAGFNGEADIQVFDADRFVPITQTRCNNLPGCQYRTQTDVIFSGRVSVTNGEFNSQFIVPNDISYADTTGRILLYARDDQKDAVGSFSDVVFNGRNPDAINDGTGPDIQIFMNDTDFADGGIVNDSPRLLVVLEDQSGINTAGAGVGHELTATIVNEQTGSEQTIILNNFYRSELDDFTRGRVEYPLDRLQDGRYTLRVRAWDVFNNMSEEEIGFEVTQADDLQIRNVYNYPNPMSNYTRFVFEHNQSGQELDVLIRVYTLSGRPVARIQRENLITTGNLIQLPWNGRDDDGNLLAAGTYLYHVQVRGNQQGNRRTQERTERLVIIR